jgi:hypothetical protein
MNSDEKSIKKQRVAKARHRSMLLTAYRHESMACNPLPFLHGIAELVRDTGTDAIQGDDAKRMLWMVIAQAYGQMEQVDLCEEWSRLCASDRREVA